MQPGQVAIQARQLAKQYRIEQGAPRYRALRDELTQWAGAPLQSLRARLAGQPQPQRLSNRKLIWALKDVSFDIERGQVVGIIGRNGSGKSTLLKILARITAPTLGVVDLYGRTGALLEIGTGFHHELTGRENIFLNGAILGMQRSEISVKFDEIVAFAEMEKFIDTPVKFYSSGMFMRLAFAVAAHLETEILLIDEVLAVGDAAFQKKCLGKMNEVAGQGRTVLFVSHQMNAVLELCPRCLWLDRGLLVEQGDSRAIVNQYLRSGISNSAWTPTDEAWVENNFFRPTRFALVDADLKTLQREVRGDEKIGVLIEGQCQTTSSAVNIGFALYAASGELLFWSFHTDTPETDWPVLRTGENRLLAWLPAHLFNEGDYRIELNLSLHFQEWICQPGVNAPSLSFSMRGGLSQSPNWLSARPGVLAPVIPFQLL
jgi:lipopolysaccharide transport system ATP-binding protein